MAASSSQKSDLLQIVMLTFFLCAVFFTGWGIFSNLKTGRLLAERQSEARTLTNLERELKDAKSIQTLLAHRAREKSKEHSGQIDTAVSAVLKNSSLTYSTMDPRAPKPQGGGSSKVFEHTLKLVLNPAPINDVYTFLARLEAQAPHLSFRSLKISSKQRRPEDPDVWQLDVTLVTYTTEI
jgi:hypothetical protein